MREMTIASFVLRFTQEQASGSGSASGPWHGVIRHVQSDEETHFKRMEDALAFVSRFVDLTDETNHAEQGT